MIRYLTSKSLISFYLILIILAPTVSAHSPGLPLVPTSSMATITPKELRKHLSFLASSELGGRYTFSNGNRIAARYLASQLESFGYHGAARDGSFLQKIEFTSSALNGKDSRIEIVNSAAAAGSAAKSGAPALSYSFGEDFYTPAQLETEFTAPAVFVGYGISAPEKGHDDYAGLDLTGKIAIISGGIPQKLQDGISSQEQGVAAARTHGARALMVLPTDDNRSSWRSYGPDVEGDEDDLTMVGEPATANNPVNSTNPIYLEISARLAESLLASIKLTTDEVIKKSINGEQLAPAVLPLALKLQIVVRKAHYEAQNVVAILEGSDPKLKKEYLMISAHYDHLKSSGGLVYCGADDDGSGTAAVLAIAHALASGTPPKRSIIVAFHTGEELGLYGSRYFTEIDPLVPLDAIVTDLNIDMIGRSRAVGDKQPQDRELTDKDSLYIIGSDKHSSELHRLSEQTNAELTNLNFDYTYNSESHPLRLYYRSDHFNYASKGIPVIFYFTGLHADYHRASDTVEKIDFDKMARITRLVYATAWRVANLNHRPLVDRWKKS